MNDSIWTMGVQASLKLNCPIDVLEIRGPDQDSNLRPIDSESETTTDPNESKNGRPGF